MPEKTAHAETFIVRIRIKDYSEFCIKYGGLSCSSMISNPWLSWSLKNDISIMAYESVILRV